MQYRCSVSAHLQRNLVFRVVANFGTPEYVIENRDYDNVNGDDAHTCASPRLPVLDTAYWYCTVMILDTERP